MAFQDPRLVLGVAAGTTKKQVGRKVCRSKRVSPWTPSVITILNLDHVFAEYALIFMGQKIGGGGQGRPLLAPLALYEPLVTRPAPSGWAVFLGRG